MTLTLKNKQKIIMQIAELLNQLIDVPDEEPVNEKQQVSQPVEMLTIKECAEAVSGLSEHTVRQLVKQGKIPSIRTGAGKNGKILVSKAALLNYINGNAA